MHHKTKHFFDLRLYGVHAVGMRPSVADSYKPYVVNDAFSDGVKDVLPLKREDG